MSWAAALSTALASPFVGSIEEVAAALRAIRRAGIEEVMFDLPTPIDRQTLEAIAGPVRNLLA